SKAALGDLTSGDTVISVNGSSAQSLREINDIIDAARDQLIIEVQSSTFPIRGGRLDSSSSLDKENSPVRYTTRTTTQTDYNKNQHHRPSYSSYSPTTLLENSNYRNLNTDQQLYTDTYGRSIINPLPAIFHTATVTVTSPTGKQSQSQSIYQSSHANSSYQPQIYRPSTNNYDIPKSYSRSTHDHGGYASDTNDMRHSNISTQPYAVSNRRAVNVTTNIQHNVPSSTYNISNNDATYHSDSEYVTSGPRYYKIARQTNSSRRPSNVVLPIKSLSSKAYDNTSYIQQQQPTPSVQHAVSHFDFNRYQQQQQSHHQESRQLPQSQQRSHIHHLPPRLVLPQNDYGYKPEVEIDQELGAELLKSPITNKKRYADSSFFTTPYNTYPTIEEQKKMAHKIANILEGDDPLSKGHTKFERQREKANKFIVEGESTSINSNYRPLKSVQAISPRSKSSTIPECIQHSLNEAQYINPLRYVGAPEEFKHIHMQEHVIHNSVAPQLAAGLVADLNENRGKGAALFQKRKARSEKWVIDENNVKKQSYQPTSSYIGETTKPWGQRASSSWSGDESYSTPSYSPVRPMYSFDQQLPEPTVISPVGPRFSDFNVKPKGWHSENVSLQSQRPPVVDQRKSINLNIGPSIREGIMESHTRSNSVPWSPSPTAQKSQEQFFAQQQQQQSQEDEYWSNQKENLLSKWKNQDYVQLNQHQQQQIPVTREGVENLRRQLTQNQVQEDHYNDAMKKAYGIGPRKFFGSHPQLPSHQQSQSQQYHNQQQQQHHFTDL
ncbi:unnamed protein product, partial [Didymodactylos carnosus]